MILARTNLIAEIAGISGIEVTVRAIHLGEFPRRLRWEPGKAVICLLDGEISYCRAERVGNAAEGWLSVGTGLRLGMQWVRIGFGERAAWMCPRCDSACVKLYLVGDQPSTVGCTRCMKDILRRTFRRHAKALRLEDQIRGGRKRYMHRTKMERMAQRVRKLRELDIPA
jgi:hypothetical protein